MLLAGTTNSVGSATFPEWLPPLIIIPVMVLIVLMIRKSRKGQKLTKKLSDKAEFYLIPHFIMWTGYRFQKIPYVKLNLFRIELNSKPGQPASSWHERKSLICPSKPTLKFKVRRFQVWWGNRWRRDVWDFGCDNRGKDKK